MAYQDNNNGEIKDIPEVPMLGAEGGLGLISGIVGRVGKAFLNTAKQYLRKPAIAQQTARKGGESFWPTTRNTGDLYANARKRA